MNNTSADKQAGRRGLAIVLAVIGVLALALAAIYFFDATALPSVLEGRSHHGHHLIRVVISLAIAIACLILALVAARRPAGPPAASRGGPGGSPPRDSTVATSTGTGAGGAADPAAASAPAAGADPWQDAGTAQWQSTTSERDSGPGSGAAGPG